MNQLSLSIVIPAYNEERRLPKMLDDALSYLKKQNWQYEIIIVDDGSQDQTSQVVKNYQKKYPAILLIRLRKNQGKARAVKTGILKSRGEMVLFADADGSTPFNQITKMMAKYKTGYPVVIGSRGVGKVARELQPIGRRAVGVLLRILTKWLVLGGIQDTQCGFKLFKTSLAKELFKKMTTTSPIFDIEILLLATLEHQPIAEIPVVWKNVPETHVPFSFKNALIVWKELLRLRKNYHLRRPPKIEKRRYF